MSAFDESKIPLSGIKDIVYDYDSYEEDLYSEDFYGDYDETFTPPAKSDPPDAASSNPFGVDINFDDYALSDIRNIEYDYDYDDEYNEIDVTPPADQDIKTNSEERIPPFIHYKYKLLSPGKEYVRFTATQLKYMGIQKQPRTPSRPPRRPEKAPSPLHLLVSSLQNKLNFLVGVITRKVKLPKIVG